MPDLPTFVFNRYTFNTFRFAGANMKTTYASAGAMAWILTAAVAMAQQVPAGAPMADRLEVGQLSNGARVTLVRSAVGDWGIEVEGGTGLRMTQGKPAEIEVYRAQGSGETLAGGYQGILKEGNGVVAKATVKSAGGAGGGGKASFDVEDRWTITGATLTLSRKVNVTGAEDNAGFNSAIRLMTDGTFKWDDMGYFVPGMGYNDPTYDGGATSYRAKRFTLREDTLAAPVFALTRNDGNWLAVMDMAPRGDTIAADGRGGGALIDERILVGVLGGREMTGAGGGGVELGFWMPGSLPAVVGGRGGAGGARLRYHPVKTGFSQSYQVGFRFDKSPTFRETQRDAWRWAWDNLKPKVQTVDLDVARKVMMDHLSDHVVTSGEFVGVPFLIDAVTGFPGSYHTPAKRQADGRPPASALQNRNGGGRPWNELSAEESKDFVAWAKTLGIEADPQATELGLWMKVMSGFTSKAIETADQLLLEADRDPSPRGQKMRQQGLAIINCWVTKVSFGPPNAAGYNLYRKEVTYAPPDTLYLRQLGEDVRQLVDTYAREKKLGRDHPEWLAWVKKGADWLLTQQQPDGSFPRSWNAPVISVKETSGTSSYNPIPMLVRLSEETGDKKYLDAALRAGDYLWKNFGSKGDYVGGTTDNPNISDKEAGMLALEAYLTLYESTKDAKWLDCAKGAGDFTESWIWIWNVPMPVDADDAALQWKRGVPTIGAQGINSRGGGSVDEYLSWAVPCYARLYKYTNDTHYLDVARILLHGTKAMLAMPGRTYDLKGPGWQQEAWNFGPNRGYGGHRSWLPWVSDVHLHGITALEQFDPALYQKLAKGE
jgi:hypothetical protein